MREMFTFEIKAGRGLRETVHRDALKATIKMLGENCRPPGDDEAHKWRDKTTTTTQKEEEEQQYHLLPASLFFLPLLLLLLFLVGPAALENSCKSRQTIQHRPTPFSLSS